MSIEYGALNDKTVSYFQKMNSLLSRNIVRFIQCCLLSKPIERILSKRDKSCDKKETFLKLIVKVFFLSQHHEKDRLLEAFSIVYNS